MSEGRRIPLTEAEGLAHVIAKMLEPACDRIEVAGSIRRRKSTIGDIELVIAPKFEPEGENLLGEPDRTVNREFELVNRLVVEGVFEDRLDKNGHRARGEKFQRLLFEGIAFDLFCVIPPAQWGVIMMIRTGSKEFNERIVTTRVKGGTVLQIGQEFRDGTLWDRGQVVSTPAESDVFEYLGIPWIAPEDRNG